MVKNFLWRKKLYFFLHKKTRNLLDILPEVGGGSHPIQKDVIIKQLKTEIFLDVFAKGGEGGLAQPKISSADKSGASKLRLK